MSIQFQNLSKVYPSPRGEILALDTINLTINQGTALGIVGESGAGKSTLVKMVNGLEMPTSGQVLVDCQSVKQLQGSHLRQHRSQIGMIFQHYNLLANKNVRDNVHLPLTLHRYKDSLSVEEVLDFVGLADKADAYPAQLSGGQQQRVGIARALVTKPKILLCDEPTSALDDQRLDEIARLLTQAHQEFGMTLLLVTHQLDLVQKVCQEVAVMEAGRIVDQYPITRQAQTGPVKSYRQRVKEVLVGE